MKTVAIGDTHGRQFWKYLTSLEDVDRIVFIGDYFDSFDYDGKHQLENFLDIIEYKQSKQKEVILLIGNHDFHYMDWALESYEEYSGFQDSYAKTFNKVLRLYKDELQMAYQMDDYIFTHAGITNTWLKERCLWDGVVNIVDCINDTFKAAPDRFSFNSGVGDMYGDHPSQSPIWVRPNSLISDPIDFFFQVVGHTGQKRILLDDDPFYFIDTLGTSREYLVIEDGIVSANKL